MSGKRSNRIQGGKALTGEVVIDEPEVTDGAVLWRIARDSGRLDLNSSYAYLLWCRDFRDTSVVARAHGEVVGFVTGYLRPGRPDTLLVWQVAVEAAWRGRGLAAALLDQLVSRLIERGVSYLETTVTEDNVASNRMFGSLARRWAASCARTELFAAQAFPDNHAPELLYRIGPFERVHALS